MKTVLLRNLIPLGIYPNIGFTYSPFKMLEFQAMMDQIKFQGNETALDIGCGDGLHTLLIGKKVGKITGIDINTAFVETARSYAAKMGKTVNADFFDQPLEKLGFPDNHFDVIFSICVIEHISNHEEVLQECLRILKPGGKIIFTVDTLETINDPELLESHRRQHHVVRYFRQDSLRELLSVTGFSELKFQALFRSPLANELFIRGIRKGFNFGRIRSQILFRKLGEEEKRTPAEQPGIFLLATAIKPKA